MIETRWVMPFETDAVQTAIDIRIKVFCEEQGFPKALEKDSYDDKAIHLLQGVDGKWCSTGRLIQKHSHWYIGRVAILQEYRRQGLGDMLMRMLIRKARQLGAGDIRVDAQLHAIPFYATLGFIPDEEGTHMDGPVEHKELVLPAGKEPPSQCGHAL